MNLNDLRIDNYLGSGTVGKCYVLKNGDVFKKFNQPLPLSEIEKFKYFLKFYNPNILFPFEFIYDKKNFYGYISKRAFGKNLIEQFPKSDLLKLSRDFVDLEYNIKYVSQGKIVMNDSHEGNIIYDGKKLSVIDVDDYEVSEDSIQEVTETNINLFNKTISNLFINNLYGTSYRLIREVNFCRYLNTVPSELILIIKNKLDKHYKEDIKTMEDLKKIR